MSLLLLLGGGGGPPVPSSDFPTLSIEIAFGYTWQDEDPVFTDVTGYVEFGPGLSIRRGRSRELDAFQAGTCRFVLMNDDRRFDPLYEDGPYFGLLEDMVPCRVRASFGWTYDLFRGFVEAWPQTYTTANHLAYVDLTAVDGFAVLAQTGASTGAFTLDDAGLGVLDEDRLAGAGGSLELSGERVDAFLDVAGWPSSLRSVAVGATECQAQDVDDDLLAALRVVEQSEDGFFYVEADGKMTFVGRHDRQTVTRLSDVQATFSDVDGDMPYSDLQILPKAVEFVANDVRRQREGGVEQTVVDAASIGKRGRRTHSLSGLVMSDDGVARDLAAMHLMRYAEPGTRIDGLVIDPGNNRANLWPQVLGRRILDRIEIDRTPQSVGDPIAAEVLIQGIEHTYSLFSWRTRWYVTPADSTQFFTLDDADLGVLDEDLIGA